MKKIFVNSLKDIIRELLRLLCFIFWSAGLLLALAVLYPGPQQIVQEVSVTAGILLDASIPVGIFLYFFNRILELILEGFRIKRAEEGREEAAAAEEIPENTDSTDNDR